ncbi:MAG: VOC family protein [Chitinophagaceae bacterium]|nr:VOC family protein [Chitinophagaceae bacterium]
MTLEHAAIWTDDVERLKEFYMKYFGAAPNNKYINPAKEFESYFLSFKSGARLEIMKMKGVPDNLNDTVHQQHKGIIHLVFGVDSVQEVDAKAKQMKADGFPILSGPKKTGDGYYEFETPDP